MVDVLGGEGGGGYQEMLDSLLRDGDGDGDGDGGTGWIGTEEDILVMMMQRDVRAFRPVRSGDV